jgi:hypothetical protein
MAHLTMADMASRKMSKGFRTPSGGVSQSGRDKAEKQGDAMPGGRFPIRNKSDLSNAKHAFGRAKDKPKVRGWINKRARELGEPPMGSEKKSGKTSRRNAMYDHPRSRRD